MIRSRARAAAVGLVCALALGACGGADRDGSAVEPSEDASSEVTRGTAGPTPSRSPRRSPSPTPSPTQDQPARGIDASHHQGAIDWQRVAADDVSFAYLKATEGSSFTDPEFTHNWRSARAAGIRTGGYHYYTLCSPPEPQADHFTATLDAAGAKGSLPPVVDLELIGNCDPPPARGALLDDVRALIDRVERATGRRVVVYFHPDFEEHYGMVAELDRRLWVRKIGERPPPGDWFIWQRNDRASVAGIQGPVDINVMR